MADISDENSGGKVDEPIAGRIRDAEVLCPVPDQRQLTMHGSRLHLVESFKNQTGSRRRDVRLDPPVIGLKTKYGLWIP